MFTGIVEEMGTVRRLNQSPNRCELELSAAKVLEGTQIGDSIAVNGVCLTVIRMDEREGTPPTRQHVWPAGRSMTSRRPCAECGIPP